MAERQQWGSKIGFILAASGSAIGLGNIVFFPANAYKFGSGAFYIPYLIALLLVGIPVMILEFGLGHHTRLAFPQSMRKIAGRGGEFFGWWAVLNACWIAMYYITILGWVIGMWLGAFGDLWAEKLAVPAFGFPEGAMPTPQAHFFNMITGWSALGFVAVIWVLNALIVWKGIRSIEAAVKLFVPLMWIFMIVLIVRGLTLPHGTQGVMVLFTPNLSVMKQPEVWQGAFSQIFFTLSLGFGIMTAYASYLPKDSDQVNNALMTSTLNCSFEYIAGIAIFSMLFAFALVPKASTLSMMFFIVPQGIGSMPAAVQLIGVLFFTLLLLAGLSSSISLVEALVSSLADKYGALRSRLLIVVTACGFVGSALFAMPHIIDAKLDATGTLGLTLLDLIDHWAFSYGLLIAGLVECIIIGWVFGIEKLIHSINESSKFRLGSGFAILVRVVIPAILIAVLAFAAYNDWIVEKEVPAAGATPAGADEGSGAAAETVVKKSLHVYGEEYIPAFVPEDTPEGDRRRLLRFLPAAALLVWVFGTLIGAFLLSRPSRKDEEETR